MFARSVSVHSSMVGPLRVAAPAMALLCWFGAVGVCAQETDRRAEGAQRSERQIQRVSSRTSRQAEAQYRIQAAGQYDPVPLPATGVYVQEVGGPVAAEARSGAMSREERRQLRKNIEEAGRDVYRGR